MQPMETELPKQIIDWMNAELSEEAALTLMNERRARYWMTNLAVLKRVTAIREYLGKINKEDIKFLRVTPNSAEAIAGLKALAREAEELAFKLADRDNGMNA
jgi:hypothetical protein